MSLRQYVCSTRSYFCFFPTAGSIFVHGVVTTMIGLLVITLLASCANPNSTITNLSGSITVVGSTALQPLANKAATLFEKDHLQVKINVKGGGSLVGLDSVTSKKADVGDSDVYADPAVYPDPNLTDHIVCVVPFTMIVSPDIHISSLTIQQIIDIFATGKYQNWSQLQGPNIPIKLVGRPASSGTRATFRRYVLGGRDQHPTNLTLDSSTAVRDTVARTSGAISYLAISALDPKVHVNQLAIGGIAATSANVESGAYPFWSYEHMYTLGDSAGTKSDLITAFLNFMQTPDVQQQAERMGYIQISAMKLSLTNPPMSR